jgi:hypothetical protein
VATQLKLYNDALTLCGERQLSSLSENVEPRHLLDSVWNNGGVNSCLEAGQWRFALRAIELDYTVAVDPTFGYNRAFVKPTDWVATSSLCSDEYFTTPLLQYVDEAGYWYADLDVLYIRYVSNDSNYGTNYTSWPAKFADFVAAHLASKVVLKLTSDADKFANVMELRKNYLVEAKNLNAMGDPTQFPPDGSWVNGRRGRSRGDRGNRGQLIG